MLSKVTITPTLRTIVISATNIRATWEWRTRGYELHYGSKEEFTAS